jgi:AbrB family looped-hinge helix DNA binding protein
MADPDKICHMQTIMVNLGKNGRLVIPAPFRRALGIEPGDELVLTLDAGLLRITTREHAILRAQETVRRHVRGSDSLVDELIEERRAEARSE